SLCSSSPLPDALPISARALDLGAGEPGKARVRLRADGYADGLVRAATRSRRGRVASCPSSTGGERSTLPASHEAGWRAAPGWCRSEEHTSELQSRENL